jgi:diketogulonate reductase-like aldo/keto reductase
VDAGHVRQLGISNCYRLDALTDLYQHARVKPVVLQNRFYAATGFDRALRAYCRAHDIRYQSFWTLTANPDLLAHPTVQALATAYHVTPAQILFRYLTQIGVVPLTGTTSVEHMRDDLAIIEFKLTTAECDSVSAVIDAVADAG